MVRQHRTAAAVVVTIALTASFAPTAAADPAPLTRAEAVITATDSGAAVRPNPDQQAAGSQSHSATPTNAQTQALSELQRAAVQAGLHPGVFGTNSPRVSSTSPTVVHTTHSEDGFDWGDAGIGAGGLLVLLAAGFAGASTATSNRKRRLREERATAAR